MDGMSPQVVFWLVFLGFISGCALTYRVTQGSGRTVSHVDPPEKPKV